MSLMIPLPVQPPDYIIHQSDPIPHYGLPPKQEDAPAPPVPVYSGDQSAPEAEASTPQQNEPLTAGATESTPAVGDDLPFSPEFMEVMKKFGGVKGLRRKRMEKMEKMEKI